MKYYVYAHIRLDKNSVFYIGKGTLCKRGYYSRAYNKDKRNTYWNNIINKTKWTYIILRHFPTKLEALRYETRCIAMFGVWWEGGQLCNNVKDTVTNDGFGMNHRRKIYKYSLDGEFIREYESGTEAAFDNNCYPTHISQACKGDVLTCKGFQYSFIKHDKLDKIIPSNIRRAKLKIVYQYSLDRKLINSFHGLAEASNLTGVSYVSISHVLHKRNKTSGGYFWSYELIENSELFQN